MTKKKYRYVQYSPAWERAANIVARNFVTIQTCVQCGSPHIAIYCCTVCGASNPDGTTEERKAYYDWCVKQGSDGSDIL